jgi:pimeloyl-ACP methyl ester carboxylesterase
MTATPKVSNRVVDGLTLEVREMGDPSQPLLLFLHGFPEHAGAWDEIMPAFADRWQTVAPNQRGYGGSDKPAGVEAYRAKLLVRDVLGLAAQLSPDRPFVLVGHDWGASIAYATAIAAPARVAKLVILNGVHPLPFQTALIESEAQRTASVYMNFLRSPQAEYVLSAHGFERLFGMLARFGEPAWLMPARRAAYLDAWSRPGALTAMLNWYRATPLVVPAPGETVPEASRPVLDPAALRVRMPHLLLWGMKDQALLPVSRAGLADLCDDFTLREFPDADHWIVHQQPTAVIAALRDFLERP